jgi:pilus assembly protein Flp/PilA
MRRERLQAGQGLIEYAMITVLIAVVVMIILIVLGPSIGNIYSTIVANI